MRWHFLETAPAAGTHNMAMDEALMRHSSRTGDAVFRVYGWSSPTLSLGRNQRARGHYDGAAAQALGVSFVRRPTGGRALLHDHEVTYSVAMPAADAIAASGAYDFINEVLLAGLAQLGVPAQRATGAAAIPPGLRPCFDLPTDHEIVVGGRKLVGSAQWRRGGTLLQHGSILVRDDQGLILHLMKTPPGSPPVAATLADALGWAPSISDVAGPLRDALARAIGRSVLSFDPAHAGGDLAELDRAYSDDAWTWRR